MQVLGLLPPYELEDVHRAYKSGALKTHPDRGGSAADFQALQDAYEQAQQYVRFRGSRREWMAAQVEPYMQMQAAIEIIQQLGGTVEIESIDWMQESFGDFATLADRVRSVRYLHGTQGDLFLEELSRHASSFSYLKMLDLTGATVSQLGLSRLRQLPSLKTVVLRESNVRSADVETLIKSTNLQVIDLKGSRVGWFQQKLLAWKHPRLRWSESSN